MLPSITQMKQEQQKKNPDKKWHISNQAEEWNGEERSIERKKFIMLSYQTITFRRRRMMA